MWKHIRKLFEPVNNRLADRMIVHHFKYLLTNAHFRMVILKTAVIICSYYQVLADCGEPGNSKSAPLDTETLISAHVYPENHTVSYQCQEAFLGPYYRECKNGKWTETIPKCRESDVNSLEHAIYHLTTVITT